MSLLSYNELCELVEQGVITDIHPNQINGTSIDIRLGSDIIIETHLDLNRKQYEDVKDRTGFPHNKRKVGMGE